MSRNFANLNLIPQTPSSKLPAAVLSKSGNYTPLLNNSINYTLVYISTCFIFFSYHIHLAKNQKMVLQINLNKEFL